MADEPSPTSALGAEQFSALLEVSEAIAQHRDLNELFRALARSLHRVVAFDYVSLVLHDAARNVMRLHILEPLERAQVQPGFEVPVDESPGGWVWQTQQPLLVPRLSEETRFPRMIALLREQGVQSFCLLPLSTAHRRLGALAFGSQKPNSYGKAELGFLERVARQVAVAVDNALNYQRVQSYQEQLARERDRLSLLLEVNNAVLSHLHLRALFSAMSLSLRRLLHCEAVSLALYDPENNRMRLQAIDFPAGKGFFQEEMTLPLDATPAGQAFAARQPLIFNADDIRRFPPQLRQWTLAEGLQSALCLPLLLGDRALGTLNLASVRECAFSQEDVDFLRQVAGQIAIAVENALAYRQVEEEKDKLAEEKLYLEDEIRSEHNFEEMLGASAAWKRVLEQVSTVAPTDSTVLILGETGTGKELVARAIHNQGARRDCTFVKLNCAAIPTGLLESELFGHEKGAFTGAITRRIGRFELAHRGTLFLDEVGDIPLELQPKLLRVLQEQEFERLGSAQTIRVNVRLVAATNRDLMHMVAQGQFRTDLFYRLNIFPIHVPPLRERPEDIPLLVRYFAQKYARRMSRRIESVPADAMETLLHYRWPGNVRELENFIERAVILSPASQLRLPVAQLRESAEAVVRPSVTLEEAERQHILRALEESAWVVGGRDGAAARLGLKRTTLQSRMEKLGISRPA